MLADKDDDDELENWHVYPLFGREHEMSVNCWCHPEADHASPTVFVHNPKQ